MFRITLIAIWLLFVLGAIGIGTNTTDGAVLLMFSGIPLGVTLGITMCHGPIKRDSDGKFEQV